MALIMAMSVILLLSIALMHTFENRTVETVHLANTLQRFQSETLSRSVFRAIIMSIKTKGLLFVLNNRDQWQDIPVPLNENQYFQIKKIQPIDHFFNLNRRFRADDPWPTVFLNIYNQYQVAGDPLAIESNLEEVIPVLSALNDWIDSDDEADAEFLYNNEDYADVYPEFEVKNRELDSLSEVKLIPAVQELGFSQKDLKERFRIFALEKDSNKISIDLNLSSPEEVEEFLLIFKDAEKYPNMYDDAATIRGILEERDSTMEDEDQEEGSEASDPDPRYSPPLYSRGTTEWEQALELAGLQLTADEQKLFSTTTNLLAIEYTVTTLRVTVTTETILEIEYSDSTKSLDIKSFRILQYSVN